MKLKRGVVARRGANNGAAETGVRDGELQGLNPKPLGADSPPDRGRHGGRVAPGLGLEPRF